MRTTLLAGVLVATFLGSGFSQTPEKSRAPHNAAEFDTLFQQIKNWAAGGPTINSAR